MTPLKLRKETTDLLNLLRREDENDDELIQRIMEYARCYMIIQGADTKEVEPTFKEPCRFGGFCTDKKQYENCINDSRMKNNWMCWRDGILLDERRGG